MPSDNCDKAVEVRHTHGIREPSEVVPSGAMWNYRYLVISDLQKKGSLISLNLVFHPEDTEGPWAEEHMAKVVFKNNQFGDALVQFCRNTSVAENGVRFFSGWNSKLCLTMENPWY